MILIRALMALRQKPGHSDAALAARLGYKSSSVISNWVQRGSVPRKARDKLRKVLLEGKA